jgi:formylglycine-generating enzyme required for sulfatase activity
MAVPGNAAAGAMAVNSVTYRWQSNDGDHSIELVRVPGTGDRPFSFGEGNETRDIEVAEFFIATVPVTQALWTHVMGEGSNPAHHQGFDKPVENVSWDEITAPESFLHWINTSAVRAALAGPLPGAVFRLPSEAEWEYAARGGSQWADGFRFSGSDDIDAVAWYKENSGDQTHDVRQKAANQLGLYDMCGNVWEWCQDGFTRDVNEIPADGRPFIGPGGQRILRGGCFHNGAIHCTVSKRYEIERMYGDPCIGFRLVLSAS